MYHSVLSEYVQDYGLLPIIFSCFVQYGSISQNWSVFNLFDFLHCRWDDVWMYVAYCSFDYIVALTFSSVWRMVVYFIFVAPCVMVFLWFVVQLAFSNHSEELQSEFSWRRLTHPFWSGVHSGKCLIIVGAWLYIWHQSSSVESLKWQHRHEFIYLSVVWPCCRNAVTWFWSFPSERAANFKVGALTL